MAGRYGALSAAIAALDTTKDTQNMPTELPETDTGRFAQAAGQRVDRAFDATGNRITSMANACRAAADNYENTDLATEEKLRAARVL